METRSTESDSHPVPPEKAKRPSFGAGIVFLLFAIWLVYAGRSAATRGDVVTTELGAGWISPQTAYIVAILFFGLAVYLFIAYFRWTRRKP